jgi:hypothetical protein
MKYLIIDLMRNFANNYNSLIIENMTENNKIKVLNALTYIAIYQKVSGKNEFEPKKIVEYFNLNYADGKYFEISCATLKKYLVIDIEQNWVVMLIHTNKNDIYKIEVDNEDIGNSTIEFKADVSAIDTPSIVIDFKNKEQESTAKTEIKPEKIINPKPKITRKSVKKKDDFDFDR